MATFDASYIYRIKDMYSASLRRIDAATERFRKRLDRTKRSLAGMGRKTKDSKKEIDGMRASMGALAGTAGLLTAFKGMVDTASQFQQALNAVEAAGGATADEMSMLEKRARQLGETTQFSGVQAAEGMRYLRMAGMDVNTVYKSMPDMLNLAAAGSLDLGMAADIATNTLDQFGLKADQLVRINDRLAYGAANANTTVGQMAEALTNTGKQAHAAGLQVEDTAASLMIMASSGSKGGRAGTFLMNALREIATQGPKIKKLFRTLNIEMGDFVDKATGNIKDFPGLLDALGKETEKSKMGLKRFSDAFDVRSAKAMLTLVSAGGDKFRELRKELYASDGAAKKMAKTMMKGLPGAQKRLTSATESLSLSFTKTFLPALSKVMESLAGIFADMANAHPMLLKIIAAAGGFAIALGVVATAGLLLAPVLGAISIQMVAITGGLILLIPAIIALMKWMSKSGYFKKLGQWIESAYTRLVKWLSGLGSTKALFLGMIDGTKDFFGFLFDVVLPAVAIAFDGILSAVGSVLTLADRLFGILGDIITLNFDGAWDKMKNGFKEMYDSIVGFIRQIKDEILGLFGLADKKKRKIVESRQAAYDKSYKQLSEWRERKKGPKGIQEEFPTMGFVARGKELAQLKAQSAMKISGGIKVSAEQGTSVKDPWIYVDNNGQNLAGVGK